MKKAAFLYQLFLRIALGSAYLVFALDRLGVWGSYGAKNVSWGDWKHFLQYASEVMSFLPQSIIQIFAVTATACEIIFGLLLIIGKWTRWAAIGSGLLALMFAVSMAISLGIVSPLSYSVFTVSAASFLLSTVPQYKWSLDALSSK
jgi:putative oxidoreductase